MADKWVPEIREEYGRLFVYPIPDGIKAVLSKRRLRVDDHFQLSRIPAEVQQWLDMLQSEVFNLNFDYIIFVGLHRLELCQSVFSSRHLLLRMLDHPHVLDFIGYIDDSDDSDSVVSVDSSNDTSWEEDVTPLDPGFHSAFERLAQAEADRLELEYENVPSEMPSSKSLVDRGVKLTILAISKSERQSDHVVWRLVVDQDLNIRRGHLLFDHSLADRLVQQPQEKRQLTKKLQSYIKRSQSRRSVEFFDPQIIDVLYKWENGDEFWTVGIFPYEESLDNSVRDDVLELGNSAGTRTIYDSLFNRQLTSSNAL